MFDENDIKLRVDVDTASVKEMQTELKRLDEIFKTLPSNNAAINQLGQTMSGLKDRISEVREVTLSSNAKMKESYFDLGQQLRATAGEARSEARVFRFAVLESLHSIEGLISTMNAFGGGSGGTGGAVKGFVSGTMNAAQAGLGASFIMKLFGKSTEALALPIGITVGAITALGEAVKNLNENIDTLAEEKLKTLDSGLKTTQGLTEEYSSIVKNTSIDLLSWGASVTAVIASGLGSSNLKKMVEEAKADQAALNARAKESNDWADRNTVGILNWGKAQLELGKISTTEYRAVIAYAQTRARNDEEILAVERALNSLSKQELETQKKIGEERKKQQEDFIKEKGDAVSYLRELEIEGLKDTSAQQIQIEHDAYIKRIEQLKQFFYDRTITAKQYMDALGQAKSIHNAKTASLFTLPEAIVSGDKSESGKSDIKDEEKDFKILTEILHSGFSRANSELDKMLFKTKEMHSVFQAFVQGAVEGLIQLGEKLAADAAIAGILAILSDGSSIAGGDSSFGSIFSSLSGIKFHASGGYITEPVFGIGASGQRYAFGENGTERIAPLYGGGHNGATHVIVHGEFTQRGDDLHAVVRQANNRAIVVGGGAFKQ